MGLQIGGNPTGRVLPTVPIQASPSPTDETQPGPSVGPPCKDKDKALPSFWIPSLTPEAKATKLEKPVSSLRVPEFLTHPRRFPVVSPPASAPLTLPASIPAVAHRDLPHVREASAHVGLDARALHATRRLRGPRGAHHAQRALRVRSDPGQPEQRHALRRAEALVSLLTRREGTSRAGLRGVALGLTCAPPCRGAVVTLECVEKLIRKDMVDPVNGDKLTERDIIVLQRVSRLPVCPPLPLPLRPASRAPPLSCPHTPPSLELRPRPTCVLQPRLLGPWLAHAQSPCWLLFTLIDFGTLVPPGALWLTRATST